MRKFMIAGMLLLLCCILGVSVCAKGVVFTDTLSGMQITLPDGWDKMHTEDGDETAVCFAAEEYMPIISFTAMDCYKTARGELAFQQIVEHVPENRMDYDNSYLSKEALATGLECSADDISYLSVGGREYFSVQMKHPDDSGDIHMLVRMESGILYVFAFEESPAHPRHDDFLAMVADAKYPVYSMDEKTAVRWELLIVLLSLVLHCLPVVVYRFGIKKGPRENAKEISIIYGIGAVLVSWGIGNYLDVPNIGVCTLGIAAGGILNYKLLSK